MQQYIQKILNYVGFLNEQQQLSLTNITVLTFLFITAFKTLFAGSMITFHYLTWNITALDLSETLPLLFGLLNYMHKRTTFNKEEKETQSNEQK